MIKMNISSNSLIYFQIFEYNYVKLAFDSAECLLNIFFALFSVFSLLQLIEIVIMWVDFTIPFGFNLFWHFGASLLNFWNFCLA